MSDRKMTQCDMILDYMRQYGPITQMEALDLFGCARLASRINDLRRAGYNIKTTLVSKKVTYFGIQSTVRFAQYTLTNNARAI